MRFLGCTLLLATLLPAQTDSAKIISSGKGWRDDRGPLARGRMISVNAIVKGTERDSELILECSRGWIQYVCKSGRCSLQPCTTRDALSKSGNDNVQVSELGAWNRLSAFLFTREPKEVFTLGVRATGNPIDALLLQDARGTHFGATLAKILEGHYCLRLSPLPSGPQRTVEIDWNRSVDAEGIVATQAVTPGVYLLEKGTPGTGTACEVDSDSSPAWITVLSPAQYSQASAIWKTESARISEIERGEAGPSAATILRHALLASLLNPSPTAK